MNRLDLVRADMLRLSNEIASARDHVDNLIGQRERIRVATRDTAKAFDRLCADVESRRKKVDDTAAVATITIREAVDNGGVSEDANRYALESFGLTAVETVNGQYDSITVYHAAIASLEAARDIDDGDDGDELDKRRT